MASAKHSILIVNPNTTQSMTDALKPLVKEIGFQETVFDFFTAPSGVPSINNEQDAAISTDACLPSLIKLIRSYDAFLVCCYSQHPLVSRLRAEASKAGSSNKPITGILEASIAFCLQSLDIESKFGIVSTGKQWEEILGEATENLLGCKGSARYAGTETTGLNADELHSTPKVEVDKRMKDATKRLLERGAKAICLGCAGMAGMDQTIREACVEQLGEGGKAIKVVDGVVSGVIHLEGALRAGM
ncbi:hypothetical protein KC363_g1601 [Hortaea werneckii]|uniref:Asp/Glu/hydantoin racemase n=1 Tax=Hortaea werneckii TaxID=91943 RepID=A0A3M7G4X6_HORWE|nr:hypothetical protein KC361_g2376 [Hortaea werneckii]KAI6887237.1 hypothetical protein KC325_g2217 [Hortaea werneckii]KAI6997672.1 hypothetical protein KC359_g2780 [Hortaea werneckii]KAI7148742.1 hypothetical protein KC344_g1659 [Hortaea werneckii]KAI7178341.1 hypothetical protein KC360_g1631 [Hortaea werneckii]